MWVTWCHAGAWNPMSSLARAPSAWSRWNQQPLKSKITLTQHTHTHTHDRTHTMTHTHETHTVDGTHRRAHTRMCKSTMKSTVVDRRVMLTPVYSLSNSQRTRVTIMVTMTLASCVIQERTLLRSGTSVTGRVARSDSQSAPPAHCHGRADRMLPPRALVAW
jgi:hypothetical protein